MPQSTRGDILELCSSCRYALEGLLPATVPLCQSRAAPGLSLASVMGADPLRGRGMSAWADVCLCVGQAESATQRARHGTHLNYPLGLTTLTVDGKSDGPVLIALDQPRSVCRWSRCKQNGLSVSSSNMMEPSPTGNPGPDWHVVPPGRGGATPVLAVTPLAHRW